MADAWKTVEYGESRGFTTAIIELVEEGVMEASTLMDLLLSWMSESEVEEFCTRCIDLRDEDNLPIIRRVEDVEEEDPLDDFNYVGSRHHY